MCPILSNDARSRAAFSASCRDSRTRSMCNWQTLRLQSGLMQSVSASGQWIAFRWVPMAITPPATIHLPMLPALRSSPRCRLPTKAAAYAGMTWTALPITSAGRFSPLGPLGMTYLYAGRAALAGGAFTMVKVGAVGAVFMAARLALEFPDVLIVVSARAIGHRQQALAIWVDITYASFSWRRHTESMRNRRATSSAELA